MKSTFICRHCIFRCSVKLLSKHHRHTVCDSNLSAAKTTWVSTGSMLEGGGQILRNAAALAAITSTPIKVTKIRASRSKPGLRAQHLAGLQLVADLCQGKLSGGTIGSQEISLKPQHISSGHHIGDTKTAGSCMLLAQVEPALSTKLLTAPFNSSHMRSCVFMWSNFQAICMHVTPSQHPWHTAQSAKRPYG